MIKKIIMGNWKMNPESLEEAKKLGDEIRKKIVKTKRTTVVLCPPAVFFNSLKPKIATKNIKYGFQNVHPESSGSFTGEVSARMAKNMKAEYVIVGHSERRLMGETNEIVGKKVSSVIKNGMTAVLCVGEKEIDENAHHLIFVRDQIVKGLSGLKNEDLTKLVIAYEPVFAIGASKPISGHEIHQRNIFIKKILTGLYGKEKAFSVPILYGGSVNSENAKKIVVEGSVDGLLVGRDSLKALNFAEIVKSIDSL